MGALRDQAMPWAELAYYLSGVVLALVAVYAAQQVRLMKHDMAVRNERAAKEKALEYAGRYGGRYAELDGIAFRDRRARGLRPYSGPVGDFLAGSLPKEHLAKAKLRSDGMLWLPAMNELEAIAAAFSTGVADERIGFGIIGRSFCKTVELNYDLLCLARRESTCGYYGSIICLYGVWRPRLTKAELEVASDEISTRLDSIPNRHIPPIGSESL